MNENFKKSLHRTTTLVVTSVMLLAVLITSISVAGNRVFAEDSSSHEIYSDEFNGPNLDTDWVVGPGITNAIIQPGAKNAADSVLNLTGTTQTFFGINSLMRPTSESKQDVSLEVDFQRANDTGRQFGVGLMARSSTGNPLTGVAYGALVCLANSSTDPVNGGGWIILYKLINGVRTQIGETSFITGATPQVKFRFQFEAKNITDETTELVATVFMEDKAGKLVERTKANATDETPELQAPGTVGISYFNNFKGTNWSEYNQNMLDIYNFKYFEEISEKIAVTGVRSRMFFGHSNSTTALKTTASMTLNFSPDPSGKNYTLTFMMRDTSSDHRVAGEGKPGYTDSCGGFGDFMFKTYNEDGSEKFIDPDIIDGEQYTFYLKGTSNFRFTILLFGWTSRGYLADVQLKETNSHHVPQSDINHAANIGDFSNWTKLMYTKGTPGSIDFSGMNDKSGTVDPVPVDFFCLAPEPMSEEHMAYFTGVAKGGTGAMFGQYLRLDASPGKKYVFSGKMKIWNKQAFKIRVDVNLRHAGGGMLTQYGGTVEEVLDSVTGDFTVTFTMPEIVPQGKNFGKLDDGRALIWLYFQEGSGAVAMCGNLSLKAEGDNKELLENPNFRQGVYGWYSMGSRGNKIRGNMIQMETPDTYTNGEGTGAEVELMLYDTDMFWADTSEEFLPDQGEWWKELETEDNSNEIPGSLENLCTIKGKVLNSKGIPWVDTTIVLSSNGELRTLTDDNGYFEFLNVKSGTYELALLKSNGELLKYDEYIFAEDSSISTVDLVLEGHINDLAGNVTQGNLNYISPETGESGTTTQTLFYISLSCLLLLFGLACGTKKSVTKLNKT